MWAPVRRTAPSSPAPVAVNPSAEVHALADLQAVGVQGGAGVVAQARPGAVEAAADVGAEQADRAIVAGAGGGEPAAQEHALADLQAVGVQGGAGVVAQRPPRSQSRLPPMWAPSRRTAPSSPTPVAVNPPQEHALADLQAVGVRAGPESLRRSPRCSRGCRRCGRRPGWTAPALAGAGGGEPGAQEHAQADLQACRRQGGAGVVAQRPPRLHSRLPPM